MASSDDHERVAIPWRSRSFQVVLVSTFVLPLGVPLVSPILPLIRDAFAITDVRASYLLSVYFLPSIILSPVIGHLLDRVGRRPVLVISLITFGFVGTSITFLTDFFVILVARFVQGIAAGGIFITTVTIIADSFGGLQRNVVFGINVAVLSTGRAAYPLVGGSLALYGWNVPFVCYLAAVLGGVFVVRTFDESVRPSRSHGRVTTRRITELFSVQTSLLYGATIVAEMVAFGAIMTTVPFLLAADYGASAVTIGSILAATTVTSAIVAAANGRLARQFSNRSLVASGFLLYGMSPLVVGIAPSLLIIAVMVLLFGAGIGLILPSVDAAISRAVSAEFHAGALSLWNSATGFGRASGPLLFTAIATVTGYRSLLLVAGIVTFVIGFGGLVIMRQ